MAKPSYAVVRARLPIDIKEQAIEVLENLGITQSELIQAAFCYVATYKEMPFKKEEILIFKER